MSAPSSREQTITATLKGVRFIITEDEIESRIIESIDKIYDGIFEVFTIQYQRLIRQ